MEKEPMIIVVDDRLSKSVGRDLVTFGSLVLVMSVSVLLQSEAMQWITGGLWVIWLFARAIGAGKANRMTLDEARAKLDVLIAERDAEAAAAAQGIPST